MNDKRKYLFWLIPAALVLLAVLFFLYPRRVDVILHMPASAAACNSCSNVCPAKVAWFTSIFKAKSLSNP